MSVSIRNFFSISDRRFKKISKNLKRYNIKQIDIAKSWGISPSYLNAILRHPKKNEKNKEIFQFIKRLVKNRQLLIKNQKSADIRGLTLPSPRPLAQSPYRPTTSAPVIKFHQSHPPLTSKLLESLPIGANFPFPQNPPSEVSAPSPDPSTINHKPSTISNNDE